ARQYTLRIKSVADAQWLRPCALILGLSTGPRTEEGKRRSSANWRFRLLNDGAKDPSTGGQSLQLGPSCGTKSPPSSLTWKVRLRAANRVRDAKGPRSFRPQYPSEDLAESFRHGRIRHA